MNTKEKVLARCAELHNPAAPWINEYWELDKMRSKARYTLTKYNNGSLAKYVFDESVPDDDPVWPLAAQVLGIFPTDLNKFVNDLLHVVGNHFQFDLLTTVKRLVDKSPKPDWVKEELADSRKSMMIYNLMETAFKHGCEWKDMGFDPLKPLNEQETTRFQTIWRGCLDSINELIQSLPPDTLKEDRELVKRYLSHEFAMGNGYLTIQTESFTESVALANALKRLCGMEVGNG